MYRPDIEKAEEPEIKLPTFVGSWRKQGNSRKTSASAKASDCVDHSKLENLKEMRIPDHPTCLLRNLCLGQEAIVRTRYRTVDWFRIGKGVQQGCILSPCLFNLYTEYIMLSAGLDEAQTNQDCWEKHQQPQICR